MLTIIYEDEEILVVEKPAGMESQSSRSLEPDMVSEIKKYRSRALMSKSAKTTEKAIGKTITKTTERLSAKLSTYIPTAPVDIYVGVIHRLDRPVDGVMVYGKTKEAAASLSLQVQNGRMKKRYLAIICGKPEDNAGCYVDYLLKTGKSGGSQIVDSTVKDGKRSELTYQVRKTLPAEADTGQSQYHGDLSLVEIELITGRYHQIRIQFAGRGTPLWGDARYNPLWGGTLPENTAYDFIKTVNANKFKNPPEPKSYGKTSLALSAVSLSFFHPATGKRMEFSMEPKKTIFQTFQ